MPLRAEPPTLVALRERDGEAVARVHREAFDADGEHWDADAFRGLLRSPRVFGFKAVHATVGGRELPLRGFVLVREAAGDAEILTVAVHPAWRGRGVGRDLMEAVLRELYARRAVSLFLEVEEDNVAAIRLYRRLGFDEFGRRDGYYKRPDRAAAAAITMRLDL